MPRATAVPITPEVLNWAIEESGHQPGAVAAAAGVGLTTLNGWRSRREQPTLTEFRRLARFLKRPEAAFFLPRPPRVRSVKVEFRSPPGARKRQPTPGERLHIREATRLQRGLAWVLEELGEKEPVFPKVATSQDPERAAATARSDLGIPVAEQINWGSPFEALRHWRAALEREGIAVLFLPMGADAIRGFSLWHPRAPLVAVNTHWSAQARIYTLFHEYPHLLTRTNSICAQVDRPRVWRGGDEVERWCEQFAAAFLLPWAAVEELLTRRFRWKAGEEVSDLNQISYVANKLNVSMRATALRLVNKGIADWSLYRAIAPVSENKKKGGPVSGGRRRPRIRVDEYGVHATQTFLKGIHKDVISRDDALRYLDVADTEIPELQALTSAN